MEFDFLTGEPIDIAGLFAASHHPAAGAVVLFSGETRNNAMGKEVVCLEFEAHHSMANKMIAAILAEAKLKWSLQIAVAQHRTGRVAVCECAVVVITAASHRKEAYAANRYIIDRIKHEAPIWKYEHFSDGTGVWGGNCNCYQETGNLNSHVYEFESSHLKL